MGIFKKISLKNNVTKIIQRQLKKQEDRGLYIGDSYLISKGITGKFYNKLQKPVEISQSAHILSILIMSEDIKRFTNIESMDKDQILVLFTLCLSVGVLIKDYMIIQEFIRKTANEEDLINKSCNFWDTTLYKVEVRGKELGLDYISKLKSFK